MSKPSLQQPGTFQYNERYLIIGLLLLCVAMLCFGVGVFIDSPTSVWGITFAIIGFVVELGANASFFYYAYRARKNRRKA